VAPTLAACSNALLQGSGPVAPQHHHRLRLFGDVLQVGVVCTTRRVFSSKLVLMRISSMSCLVQSMSDKLISGLHGLKAKITSEERQCFYELGCKQAQVEGSLAPRILAGRLNSGGALNPIGSCAL